MAFLYLDDRTLAGQCAVDLFRSSGPGGQKRNKTDSAVRLRHGPTGLMVTAVEDRSQHVNRARALRRLRHAIALNIRAAVDPAAYRPSETMRAYLTGEGLAVSPKNDDYPCVLAELMDLLVACGLRVGEAAACLGVSTSNLVHQLRKDPTLWRRVNELRVAAGMGSLKA